MPLHAENGREALDIGRDMGLAGIYFPDPLGSGASAMPWGGGSLRAEVDTVVLDYGPAAAFDAAAFDAAAFDAAAFDAAAAARHSMEECGISAAQAAAWFPLCRAAAALGRILDRRRQAAAIPTCASLCRAAAAAPASAAAAPASAAAAPASAAAARAPAAAAPASAATARAPAAAPAEAGSPGIRRGGFALAGLMAAGKSATGRALSRLLGLPFLDLDALVEAAAGMSVADIFGREGEAAFRLMERAALERAEASRPCVLALGGGAILAAENRVLLRRSFATVWLHASAETAAVRSSASGAPTRPLLGGAGAECAGAERAGPDSSAAAGAASASNVGRRDAAGSSVAERAATLARLFEERRALYAECADLVVSTEGRDPEAVAEVIREEIDIAL